MSHAGFQWSDEQPQGPPASGGDSRFVWSDEKQEASAAEPPKSDSGLGMGGAPLTDRTVPNGRIRNMTVDPVKDVHSAGHALYEGAKTGLMLGSIPASVGATVPELIGGAVGGTAGSAGGKAIAKVAGGGDTAQEVAGDLGGLVGGGIGASRIGGGIRGFLKPIAEAIHGPTPALPTALPEQLNPALTSPSRSLPGQIGPEVIHPRIAPAEPIPPRQGLMLPEAQDPILERLRANAARIAQEGHGDEIPEPVEASPTTTNLNEDLTPALKASLRKALAAKRVRSPKPQPIQ